MRGKATHKTIDIDDAELFIQTAAVAEERRPDGAPTQNVGVAPSDATASGVNYWLAITPIKGPPGAHAVRVLAGLFVSISTNERKTERRGRTQVSTCFRRYEKQTTARQRRAYPIQCRTHTVRPPYEALSGSSPTRERQSSDTGDIYLGTAQGKHERPGRWRHVGGRIRKARCRGAHAGPDVSWRVCKKNRSRSERCQAKASRSEPCPMTSGQS
jgi:hypothetical protein